MGYIKLHFAHRVTGERQGIRYQVKPEDSCWVLNCPKPVRGLMWIIKDTHMELACAEHATIGDYTDGP